MERIKNVTRVTTHEQPVVQNVRQPVQITVEVRSLGSLVASQICSLDIFDDAYPEYMNVSHLHNHRVHCTVINLITMITRYGFVVSTKDTPNCIIKFNKSVEQQERGC